MEDFEVFQADFTRYCRQIAEGVGVRIHWDEAKLRDAHKAWCSRCAYWKSERVPSGSDGLSHVKILALLLFQLSEFSWVTVVEACEPTAPGLGNPYTGTGADFDLVRADIVDAEGTYLGFQFAINSITTIEREREDRLEPYIFRITPDFEHDILAYMLSEARDEFALYLMLKALFVRFGGNSL